MKLLLKLPPSLERGDGNIYVLFIIVAIMGISYFLVDGFYPTKVKSLENSRVVELDLDKEKLAGLSTLQLYSLSCKPEKQVVTVLMDNSSSMKGTAIDRAKEALLTLKDYLDDETILKIGTFSSEYRQILDYTKVKDINQTQYTSLISAIKYDKGTSTRDGFKNILPGIQQSKKEYPGYKQVVILITDGHPSICEAPFPNGVYKDCEGPEFASEQDPRLLDKDADSQYSYYAGQPTDTTLPNLFNTSNPSILSRIQAESNNIYVIGLFEDKPDPLITEFKTMMTDIATNPDSKYFHIANSKAYDLGSIFASLIEKKCGEPQPVPIVVVSPPTATATPTPTPTTIAVTQPPASCERGQLLTYILADTSGSNISYKTVGAVTTALRNYKSEVMQLSSANVLGLITFDNTAVERVPLDRLSENSSLYDAQTSGELPKFGGKTNIEDALKKAEANTTSAN